MSIAPNRPIRSPVMIGRARDVAFFQFLIDEAKQGRGRVLLLSGEAGIGKSRLLAEGERRASEQGLVVLRGACFPTDHAVPYAPLLDLLGSRPARDLLVPSTADPSPLVQELDRLFPGLLPFTVDARPASAGNPDQDQRRLFVMLTRFFTDLASRQPVLLGLEDLHWSDEASLEYLYFLSRHLSDQPLLLVLTYRTDERPPGLAAWLSQLDRERLAHELIVSPLARDEVEEMVRAIFAPPAPLPPLPLDAIHDLTEGNPFFIEELLKSLLAAGPLMSGEPSSADQTLPGFSVPRSVQDAVQQRLDRLSPAAQQVVTLAAVAGRRFDFTVLQQITNHNDADLVGLMKELIAAQLVIEETEERFAFRHALTREAIYRHLLRREHMALHRTLAETLEQLNALTREAHLSELADHFYEAGVWDKASAYAAQAGERALALAAPRAAIKQFSRALNAADQVAAPPLARLHHLRGQAYETLGDFEHAKADYDRAWQIGKQSHDGQMEWQSVMDLGFLWAGRDYARAGEFFRQAVERSQQLDAPTLHAHSLNRLGNWLVNTGQVAAGLAAHKQALAVFEQQHDRAGMAETHDLLGLALAWTGNYLEGRPHQERAIDLFRELDDKKGLVSTLPNASISLSPAVAETLFIVVRDPEECVRGALEAVQLARQIEWPAGEAYAELTTGALLASVGQFDRGLSHVQAGFQLAQEIDHQQWIVAARHHFGYIYIHLLAPALALRQLESGLTLAQTLGSAWFIDSILAFQALAYLQLGQRAHAEAALRTATIDPLSPRTLSERRLAWAWGKLRLAQGAHEGALAIANRLLTTAPGSPCAQPIPRLLHLKGEALVALHQPEEAVEAFEAAKRGALLRQEAPLLWQIHGALGRVYRGLKREAEARNAVAAARDSIDSLALTIDDPELRQRFTQHALASLPYIKPISPRRAAAEHYGGLTAREREVATLIAQGKSNRAIADQLMVSERTIESHVANILFKLRFAARTQVAAWVVEVGLDQP